jgi:uncharacterized HAD superfamily protein
MTQRKTIAVDIDDVLSRTAEGFIAFSNKQWAMQLTPEDYSEEWAVVWGVPLEEAISRSAVYHSSGAVGAFLPHEAAMPVLKRLAKKYNLVCVTSRREILKPETDHWVMHHFPHIFSGLHYAGIWDKPLDGQNVQARLNATKAELCRELGAEYLIDDQLKHCIGAAEAGVQAILFGNYKWNREPAALPKGITRARHWDEVAEYFNV